MAYFNSYGTWDFRPVLLVDEREERRRAFERAKLKASVKRLRSLVDSILGTRKAIKYVPFVLGHYGPLGANDHARLPRERLPQAGQVQHNQRRP